MVNSSRDQILLLIDSLIAAPRPGGHGPTPSNGDDSVPPHLIWGLGGGGNVTAVGVTPTGPEYRLGEFWAEGYADLELTDDTWLIEGIDRDVAALESSLKVVAQNKERLEKRVKRSKVSRQQRLISYLQATDPDPDRFSETFGDDVIWIDHRDDDASVVSACERALDTGWLTSQWDDQGRLVVQGKQGEETIKPLSRDVTLRCLVKLLAPDFELWQWIGGTPGDTIAVAALRAEHRQQVADAVSEKALKSQFRRIHARSKIFG